MYRIQGMVWGGCLMKMRWILCGLLCWLSIEAYATANYNFPKVYHFDHDVWELASQNQTSHSIIAEYVTNGETMQNWTQLYTYQQRRKPDTNNTSPREFAERVDTSLKGKGLDYDFKILSSSPDEAMLEFQIKKPVASQQDEIQRVIKTDRNIFVIMHYVIRQSDMGADARKQWIKNLATVPLVII